MAAVLATTAPWWLVRRAHAARQTKLVVWNPAALALQGSIRPALSGALHEHGVPATRAPSSPGRRPCFRPQG